MYAIPSVHWPNIYLKYFINQFNNWQRCNSSARCLLTEALTFLWKCMIFDFSCFHHFFNIKNDIFCVINFNKLTFRNTNSLFSGLPFMVLCLNCITHFIQVKNSRGNVLQCSHYGPVESPEGRTLPCVVYCHGNRYDELLKPLFGHHFFVTATMTKCAI